MQKALQRTVKMNLKSLPNIIINNWQIKVVCFCIALLLALFHQIMSLDRKYLSIPLTVYAEGQLLPGSTYPRFVRVSLRGLPSEISDITETDLSAFIDLNYYSDQGMYDVPVQVQLVGKTLDINPLELQVEPQHISLKLEKRLEKAVPITPSFSGTPAKGYELSGYSSVPNSVKIVGPQSIIEKVNEIYSDFISTTDRTERFTVTTPLINHNALILLQGDTTAKFSIDISPRLITRTLTVTDVTYIGLPQDLQITEQKTPITVEIIGPMNELESYTLPIYAVQADCSEIKRSGEYSIPIAVYVSDEFTVLKIDPVHITVMVEKINGKLQ